MTLPIRIISRNFELIDEVDSYSSLQITRNWHGIGSIELRVNRYLQGANSLVKGAIIFPQNKTNKAYVIRHREIELDQSGKVTENWIIRAMPLKSWLGQRFIYPPINEAQDAIEADAETVMHHYVINNAINPTDPNRIIPNLILSDNLHRGPIVSWQSRYTNLAEDLAEISLLSGLGWNIDVDIKRKKFVFNIDDGNDLTVGQSVLPPAIFSPEFNTLGQLSYTESELNYRNHAIVAGQGEGIDRRVIEVGSSTGIDRYELFVDARDVAEETTGDTPQPRPVAEIENDLITRGQQKLAEYGQEVYLEGQVLMGRVREDIPKTMNGIIGDLQLDEVDLTENGRNLLPSFTSGKWTIHSQHRVASDYELLKNGSSVGLSYVIINVEPNTSYTLSALSDFYGAVFTASGSSAISGTYAPFPIMFNSGSNRSVRVYVRSSSTYGTTLAKLKLEKGDYITDWQPAAEDGVPWYSSQPLTVVTRPISLSSLGKYSGSSFTWDANTPQGTSTYLEYSFDNVNWTYLRNGGSLSLKPGDWLSNCTLYIRQCISTTNPAVTPSITNFKYVINGYVTKERVTTARLEYEKDYDLGDMVTLQNKEWGVTLDARITEVKEIYEHGNVGIELTFGNNRPTLISKIKREISGMRTEMNR
jgi:hypothetical protein